MPGRRFSAAGDDGVPNPSVKDACMPLLFIAAALLGGTIMLSRLSPARPPVAEHHGDSAVASAGTETCMAQVLVVPYGYRNASRLAKTAFIPAGDHSLRWDVLPLENARRP